MSDVLEHGLRILLSVFHDDVGEFVILNGDGTAPEGHDGGYFIAVKCLAKDLAAYEAGGTAND